MIASIARREPAISVVIPAFNRIGPLRATLHSAAASLARVPGGGELIIVDDGSEPSVELALAGFECGHPIRHLRQANAGSIRARMAGLAQALGRYTLFLDSDDLIHPDKLAAQVAAMDDDALDMSYSDMAVVTLDSGGRATAYRPAEVLPVVTTAHELCLAVQPAQHVVVYRRSHLLKVLNRPDLPVDARFEPVGDLWLHYNLAGWPARVAKVAGPYSALGPHDQARFTTRWEYPGVASLLVTETLLRARNGDADFADARLLIGEAAFRGWRRMPRGFSTLVEERTLAIWRAVPRVRPERLGGRGFQVLARVLGTERAARLLRLLQAPSYGSCRTLAPDELSRLLARLDLPPIGDTAAAPATNDRVADDT